MNSRLHFALTRLKMSAPASAPREDHYEQDY